jgi:hypothetical protein
VTDMIGRLLSDSAWHAFPLESALLMGLPQKSPRLVLRLSMEMGVEEKQSSCEDYCSVPVQPEASDAI